MHDVELDLARDPELVIEQQIVRWMVPPIEFSSGTTPCVARFLTTASKTSSNVLQGSVSTSGPPKCNAAASLYAPGSP